MSPERPSFGTNVVPFLPISTNLDVEEWPQEQSKRHLQTLCVSVERFCFSALVMGWQTLALDNIDGRALLK